MVPALEPVAAGALADSGAVHLSLPEHVRLQLKLDSPDTKEVTVAGRSVRRRNKGRLTLDIRLDLS
jgi:hypothetical protein